MSVIDDYLQDLSAGQRAELERIRSIVKQIVPETEEAISYGMPTMRYKGKNLIHFAAFKDHMSVFPTAQPIKELEGQLKDFKTSKGTLRFTEEKPLPEPLLRELVRQRREAIDKI